MDVGVRDLFLRRRVAFPTLTSTSLFRTARLSTNIYSRKSSQVRRYLELRPGGAYGCVTPVTVVSAGASASPYLKARVGHRIGLQAPGNHVDAPGEETIRGACGGIGAQKKKTKKEKKKGKKKGKKTR